MLNTAFKIDKLTKHEYLQGELISPIKHELVDGVAYAMAGASVNHERIAGNLYRRFADYLDSTPCEPFGSDMKVKVDEDFYYPDLSVVCDFDESQPYYTETPVVLIEVLSKSTRRTDQTLKRQRYLSIPGLHEYVLVEQDIVDVEVMRRADDWRSRRYFMGDEIVFDSIGLTLSVEAIYQRVRNDDVLQYQPRDAGG